MTPQDFKQWFAGCASAIGETPNPAQWDAIKKAVAEMETAPTPAVSSVHVTEPPIQTQAEQAWARRREGW